MRAATSLSLTITVALATLIVMGGILAGPAIIDCAKNGSKFGACLRDKIASSGLIAPEGESVEKAIVTSEVPRVEPDVPSAEPEPPVVAEIPPPAGWLEAKANEYQPKPAASAVLTSAPGDLLAAGDASSETIPTTDIALAEPLDTVAATGSDAAETEAIVAALGPQIGDLEADGATADEPVAPVEIALASPAGKLSASGVDPAIAGAALTILTPRSGDLLASGIASDGPGAPVEVALAVPPEKLDAIGQSGTPAAPGLVTIIGRSGDLFAAGDAIVGNSDQSIEVALTGPIGELTASMATLEPTPPAAALTLLPRTGSLTVLGSTESSETIEANLSPAWLNLDTPLATGSVGPAPEAPAPVSLEAIVNKPIEQAIPEPPPKPVIEFNPAFPNVLVLPAPATGERSSFRTLELN